MHDPELPPVWSTDVHSSNPAG